VSLAYYYLQVYQRILLVYELAQIVDDSNKNTNQLIIIMPTITLVFFRKQKHQ
jgi:hypothetical protein